VGKALVTVVLATGVVVAVAAIAGRGSADDEQEALPFGLGVDADDLPASPPPTLVGGVALDPVDPGSLVVGHDLSFGTALPSTDAALAVLTETAEVMSVMSRRVYDTPSAEPRADLAVLTLDGEAFYDEAAVDGWVAAFVGRLVDAEPVPGEIGDVAVVRAGAGPRAALGFRRGDALVVVEGTEAHAEWVGTVMLQGLAAGEEPRPWPATPLLALPVDGAFAAVPGVGFPPFPPDDPEPAPAPPPFPGTTAVEGRIGVVGGERRATVWSIATDPNTHPTAESLIADIDALVSGRAGGAAASRDEVSGRIVTGADGPAGTRSARAFLHGRLVVLVEGADAAQVDAIVTAWVTALG
jgi:hypothetical protein